MIRSFYNGISGAKTHSFGIDINANNIANVNTTGFKYSNAQFKDIFYTTITTQSQNPSESGYGSTKGASRLIFDQGTAVLSEGEFDVALQGKGFFGVLGANLQAYYTRDGSFKRDADGNLVDSYGNFVLGTMNPSFIQINYSDRVARLMGNHLNTGSALNSGFTVNSNLNFTIGTTASQTPLKVPINLYLPPKVTQNVKWSGNLDTSTKTQIVKIDLDPQKVELERTQEGRYILSASLSKEEVFSAKAGDRILLSFIDDNGVRANFETVLDENLNFRTNELDLNGLDQDSLKLHTVQIATKEQKSDRDVLEAPIYNADGSKGFLRLTLERILPQQGDDIEYKAIAQLHDSKEQALTEPKIANIIFNKNGALIENNMRNILSQEGNLINIDLGSVLNVNEPGSGYNGIYLKKGSQKRVLAQQDGLPEGFFKKYNIFDDGSIIAHFSNGQNATIAKLALYNFINEQGLASVGENLFIPTGNSGQASFISKNGKLINTAQFKGGYLERSNVNLTVELSELIVNQKAFDANSKSITTSDQMIQRAINMKK